MAAASKKSRKNRIEFTVHGPYPIPFDDYRRGALNKKAFWDQVGVDDLRTKSGCYVFALQKRKGTIVPHYVGLTRTQGFAVEAFSDTNVRKYERALAETGHRRPLMFLIVPQLGRSDALRRYIKQVENFLIQAGARRNPDIQNVKGARPKWFIRGVAGTTVGKPSKAARKLATAMEIDG